MQQRYANSHASNPLSKPPCKASPCRHHWCGVCRPEMRRRALGERVQGYDFRRKGSNRWASECSRVCSRLDTHRSQIYQMNNLGHPVDMYALPSQYILCPTKVAKGAQTGSMAPTITRFSTSQKKPTRTPAKRGN